MRLWLLTLKDDIRWNDKEAAYYIDTYSVTRRMVIRATTQAEARRLAASKESGFDLPWWNDPDWTECTEISTDGEPSIIIAAESYEI